MGQKRCLTDCGKGKMECNILEIAKMFGCNHRTTKKLKKKKGGGGCKLTAEDLRRIKRKACSSNAVIFKNMTTTEQDT